MARLLLRWRRGDLHDRIRWAEAEWRARKYFGALKTGKLRTIREMIVPPTTVNAAGRG